MPTTTWTTGQSTPVQEIPSWKQPITNYDIEFLKKALKSAYVEPILDETMPLQTRSTEAVYDPNMYQSRNFNETYVKLGDRTQQIIRTQLADQGRMALILLKIINRPAFKSLLEITNNNDQDRIEEQDK